MERVVAFLNKPAVVSEKNLAEQVSCSSHTAFPSSPFPADWAASTFLRPPHELDATGGASHPFPPVVAVLLFVPSCLPFSCVVLPLSRKRGQRTV